MPLDIETIKKQSALSDLSDEQMSAIVTLSTNSEKQTVQEAIAEKTRDFWDKLDADIKEVYGKDKPREVKSWELLKQTLTEAKEKAESASTAASQLEELKNAKQQLEEQLKSGDKSGALSKQIERLQQQIADKDNQLEGLRTQVQTKEEEYKTRLAEEQAKLDKYQFENHMDSALKGVKFKDSIPESIREQYIQSAKERVLSKYDRDWVEENGKRIPVFRDEKGHIVTNPDNLQKPLQPHELLMSEIKDALADDGKGGAGTKPSAGARGKSVVVTGNPTTKIEATRLIHETLMQQGIAAGTDKFHTEERRLYTEMGVEDLPLK